MKNNDTILITGVAGFVGRYIARHYYQQGYTVIGIDMVSPENSPASSLSKYLRMTLPDSGLTRIIKECAPDVCIHCAGRASVGASVADPYDDFYTANVVTFELLNALRLSTPQCRFVFVSSAAVYGNPTKLPVTEDQPVTPISPYGFHKLQCEEICREFSCVYGLPIAIARIFTAYGPGLRRQVIWDICHKALIQKRVVLQGTGSESRDFIHALDIAAAIQIVAQTSVANLEVYNLASGTAVTIEKLSTIILRTLGFTDRVEFDGMVPKGNPVSWQADISKLCGLGFGQKVSFEQGLATFTNWCKAELLGI